MVTLKSLIRSIVMDGYDGNREPLDVKFPSDGEAEGFVRDFSAQYVDGFSKALVIVSVLTSIIELASPLEPGN